MSKGTLILPLGVGGGGGAQGAQGATGMQGAMGLQGVQGIAGSSSGQGIQGIQGIAGQNGTDGLQGSMGIQGIAGQNGLDGNQGIQGIAGRNGTDGIQGATGVQGAMGIQGIAGQNGVDGNQGIQGTMGIQGIAGQNGLDGNQGIQGIAGQNGIDGNQGIQGTMGIQGIMGIQGADGSGGSSNKIDIATMTPAEQLQFYTDFYTNNATNYWDYCAGGYNICEIKKMPQYVEWQFTEEDSYVTDGTELAIFIGPDHQFHIGTQWGNVSGFELEDIYYFIYLFSPTNGLIEAATRIYSNVTPDWNESSSDNKAFIKNKPALQTVSLQFTLGDSSVVNYDFYFNPQQ